MKTLRVLFIEDSEDDALLVAGELEAGGYSLISQRVDGADALRDALRDARWDLILSDFAMPRFDALAALAIVQGSSHADVPFVIVSGSIGEASAVAALKAGAANYVMKDHLSHLVPVIERELADARIRRERRDAYSALERAIQARDEFLSIASHELKTPVATLRLQAQGLKRAAERDRSLLTVETLIQRATAIDRSAERLTQLVERLLDVTRAGTGPLKLFLQEVDLVPLVQRVLRDMEESLRRAGCDVTFTAPPRVVGTWDVDRVETILVNLLSNAAKYGAHTPVRVEIDDGGVEARVTITDRGIGIAPEDQARIFERFERAVPEEHGGGFGAGLWLARTIAEAHGGSLAVESAIGRGSTFRLALPKERT